MVVSTTMTQAAAIPAKIGVISIITGPGAGYGEAITNGFKMARDEVNAKGDVKIDLIIEDSSGKQEQALAAAQKLINSDKVVAILGPTLSTEMMVVGPEANASGVPIMGTSTTAVGITQIGKYVFRNSLPEALAIPASVKKAVAKYHIKKVAMLYGNDDVFTKSGFDTMKKVATDLGLKILTIEEFQKGQADYKAQLTKIKATKPDAIFCSALYEEGGVILSQARKMGITVPFVGGNGFNSPKVIDIAKEAAEGLIVATPWFGINPTPRSRPLSRSMKRPMARNRTSLPPRPMMPFTSWPRPSKRPARPTGTSCGTPWPASATLTASWANSPLTPKGTWSWSPMC